MSNVIPPVGPVASRELVNLQTAPKSTTSQEDGALPTEIESLISSLSSDDADIRFDAIMKLIEGNDPQVVTPLIAIVSGDDNNARLCAVSILGYSGNPQAVSPLTKLLRDAEPILRQYIAGALANLLLSGVTEPSLSKPLLSCLEDEDPEVRRIAAIALGKSGNEEATKTLVECLNHEDAEIRSEASNLIRKSRCQHTPKILTEHLASDKPLTLRRYAAMLLGDLAQEGQIDSESVTPLAECLQDSDPSMRRLAAEALGKIKDPKAIEPLIACLVKDDDSEVCFEATHALCNIEDPDVVVLLFKYLINTNDNPLALARINGVLLSLNDEVRFNGYVKCLSNDDTRVNFLAKIQLGIAQPTT